MANKNPGFSVIKDLKPISEKEYLSVITDRFLALGVRVNRDESFNPSEEMTTNPGFVAVTQLCLALNGLDYTDAAQILEWTEKAIRFSSVVKSRPGASS